MFFASLILDILVVFSMNKLFAILEIEFFSALYNSLYSFLFFLLISVIHNVSYQYDKNKYAKIIFYISAFGCFYFSLFLDRNIYYMLLIHSMFTPMYIFKLLSNIYISLILNISTIIIFFFLSNALTNSVLVLYIIILSVGFFSSRLKKI